MPESTMSEQIQRLRSVVTNQSDYMYGESTAIRRELEQIVNPLYLWVYDVYQWMKDRSSNGEIREFISRLDEMEGIELYDDTAQVEYNVESEMDHRTSEAFDAIRCALDELEQAMDDDPLVRASSDARTQPLVDGLRGLAEILGR